VRRTPVAADDARADAIKRGRMPPRLVRLCVAGALALAVTAAVPRAAPISVAQASTIPIKHVVIIYQENHTFDNVLGKLCVIDHRCNGATTGKLSTGVTIALQPATDVPPNIAHDHDAQVAAIDRGKMDRFDTISGCKAPRFACLSQYSPIQIPNLAALARHYAISDATFQLGQAASWGTHLELVSGTVDGFNGDNPQPNTEPGVTAGPGWGCDSHRDAFWLPAPAAQPILVPACVPFKNGSGAYEPTPVSWIPTLMDVMDSARLTYSLDAGTKPQGTAPFQPSGYQWAICPTFADCIQTAQVNHLHTADQILTDAAAGTLPAVSIVTPTSANSQHNSYSMLAGDNWLGQVVGALEAGPEWSSTAIFIAYDDCGCFYDHVAPPTADLGPRIPVVIVSPYAIPGHTDSTIATQASFLSYSGSFSYRFTQTTKGVPMTVTPVPASSLAEMAAHPPDPNDPT
jgi:phospholipase C